MRLKQQISGYRTQDDHPPRFCADEDVELGAECASTSHQH
jgi:hypothetical protein